MAMENMPELTLTPEGMGLELEGTAVPTLSLEPDKPTIQPVEESLTPEEKAVVHEFA